MTIKEVSEKYQISESLLRYYESEGIIFKVTRKNNIRVYKQENLENIEFVLCMRNAGMSIERLKKYMQLLTVPDSYKERKQILQEQRQEVKQKLDEYQDCLTKLDYKINNYEKLMQNMIN